MGTILSLSPSTAQIILALFGSILANIETRVATQFFFLLS
jgi:hypothetical protein